MKKNVLSYGLSVVAQSNPSLRKKGYFVVKLIECQKMILRHLKILFITWSGTHFLMLQKNNECKILSDRFVLFRQFAIKNSDFQLFSDDHPLKNCQLLTKSNRYIFVTLFSELKRPKCFVTCPPATFKSFTFNSSHSPKVQFRSNHKTGNYGSNSDGPAIRYDFRL